jgi:hypothetical protein
MILDLPLSSYTISYYLIRYSKFDMLVSLFDYNTGIEAGQGHEEASSPSFPDVI